MLKIAAGIVLGAVAIYVLLAVVVVSDPKTRALATGDASDVTVDVSGTSGAFRGSIGAGGSQRSIEGTTPASFTLYGAGSHGIFVAAIGKVGSNVGSLTVSLRGCPDHQLHTGSTSAQFGLVSVTC